MEKAKEINIINDYISGLSMAKVGKKYGCNATTVSNILKRNNVRSRNWREARRLACGYRLDENAFEAIDTRDKCYWLGVMYSDGYITKTNKYTNYFGISVQESDRGWLEQFGVFLKTNHKIATYTVSQGYKPGLKYVRLNIGSNKVVQDLEKHGVLEQKSLKDMTVPAVPFLDDFIRGYIDGNGSIHHRSGAISISGGITLLTDIQRVLDVQGKVYRDKSIYCLFFKPLESRRLCQRLYQNAHCYLQRKYLLASKYFTSPVTQE